MFYLLVEGLFFGFYILLYREKVNYFFSRKLIILDCFCCEIGYYLFLLKYIFILN